ncbi:type II toxin-antitoxin system Phd/YefM family antitoxin [bacterium]|nr:type II toxin-antitoxin system Phd/YefM family antitoxin [bacterium]
MDRTNANDFRANLKEWMETARTEPVKITRKSGEAFVLINADEFEEIQMEVATLRGVVKGLTDAVQGRTQPASLKSTEAAIENARNKVFGKKSKKAVG